VVEIICDGKSTRDINLEIKRLMAEGKTDIFVKNSSARHNLGVAILQPVKLTFDSSVGYYGAGMIDGPTIEIKGSAGWGLAESMMNGTVIVHGSAGNGAGASIRGGTVVIYGDAAARAGVSMKGGLLLIAGNCGYMAGFMAQKGTIIVCGDTGEAFADSMYEAVCFVSGSIAELGNDAVIEEPTAEDIAFLESALSRYLGEKIQNPKSKIQNFKKVVAGRKLWNFDKREWKTWREAL
jgi:glutamate synthase domain-containing protein 3